MMGVKSAAQQESVDESLSSKQLPPNTSPFFPAIFFRNQFCTTPVYPPAGTDLTGRTAIVTGASSGLGFECALQLLSYGLSRLIITVRSPAKGEDAAAQLRTKYPHADIQVWLLEMASYESIQKFVCQTDEKLSRVDFVVLNAGVWKHSFDLVSTTGHEETFQVNYLSQALLTFLLLPVLKAKSLPGLPAHLTWVNSGLAFTAKVPRLNNAPPLSRSFGSKEGFDGQEAYCTSKLLAHYLLWELTEHVSADGVIISITDPGYVRGTGLMNNMKQELSKKNALLGVVAGGFMKAMERAGRTVEVGASTLVDALVNHGLESHGCYLMSWQISP